MEGPVEQHSIVITFDDLDTRAAGVAAEELKHAIAAAANDAMDDDPSVSAPELRVAKPDPSTQDPGTVLTVLISSAAFTAIAEGIRQYFASRSPHGITIRTGEGEVIATGDAARRLDADEVVRALRDKKTKKRR